MLMAVILDRVGGGGHMTLHMHVSQRNKCRGRIPHAAVFCMVHPAAQTLPSQQQAASDACLAPAHHQLASQLGCYPDAVA